MKKNILISFIVFLSSLLAKEENYEIKIDRSCLEILEVRTVFYNPGLKYKMSYPQLYCKQKRNCISKLNVALQAEMIKGFDMAISFFESKEGIEYPGYLSLKYTVNCNQLGFVNVEIYEESYLGGAHPFHTYETYLAHISQNKLITLTDIIYPTSEFWDFLSQEISKSINESSAPIPKKKKF